MHFQTCTKYNLFLTYIPICRELNCFGRCYVCSEDVQFAGYKGRIMNGIKNVDMQFWHKTHPESECYLVKFLWEGGNPRI